MKISYLFFTLICIMVSGGVQAQDLKLKLSSENYSEAGYGITSSINRNRLLKHLQILSSDDMKGRKTEEEGNFKAQGYILQEFSLNEVPVEVQPFVFERKEKEVLGTNIIATVKGTKYPDDYIAVTAHFDHVGTGKMIDNDSIYNGADDNASGVAALLAMSRFFKENPPKTSILFIALDAEEMGLQGAKYFVENNNRNIVLNVNMDMISRNEDHELYVCGARFTKSLFAYLNSASKKALPINLKLGHDGKDGKDSWISSSDHYPFFKANIPFLYFGVEDHPGYHQPSDEFENITPEFYVDAVRFITYAISDLDRKIIL